MKAFLPKVFGGIILIVFASLLFSPVSAKYNNDRTNGIGSIKKETKPFKSNNGVTGKYVAANQMAGNANALNFDGINDYVSIANPFRAFGTELTVEFWFNPSTVNLPFGSIIGQSTADVDNMATNVWIMHPETDGRMIFYVNDGGTWRSAPAINLQANSWHHIAGVASASGVKIYVDGVQQGVTNPGISGTIMNNSVSVIHIGKDSRWNNRFGNESIDEVRVWSRALCQSEILNNMNCELANPTSQTGLQEYYSFNQGLAGGTNTTINTLTDLSGNGRNGVLNNFNLTGAASNWITGQSLGSCSLFNGGLPITGTTSLCVGTTTTLTNANAGTWSSSNTAVATINASGVVTGVSAGTATITFTNGSTGCSGSSTTTVNVKGIPAASVVASGPIAFCTSGSVVLTGSGAAGNALQVNGTNYAQSVNAQLPMGNSARTMEAWIKTTQTTNGAIVNFGQIATSQRFGLLVIGGKLYFVGENNDLQGSITINDGVWHHVAVTFDGATIRLYVDGVADLTSAKTLNTTGTTLRIGQRSVGDTGSELYIGQIDEVRIWTVAKTATEIANNKNLSVASNSANLVAYYKYDEATGTTAADATANAVTANLISAPTFVASGAKINYTSYLWSNNATTSSITATAASNYSFSGTTADGCSVSSAATTVSVNALPVVTAASNSPVLVNGTVNLTAAGADTYSWTGPNSFNSTQQNPTISNAANLATGKYTVTGTSTTGCAATATTYVAVNKPYTPVVAFDPRKVTSFAGSGISGATDGTGAAAQFNNPSGIAIDASGNLYVSETAGNRIRKITAAGVVTTVAGNGLAGNVNGTGTAAQFKSPQAVALDPTGTILYVADNQNYSIRKIVLATGAVTTYAGTGTQGNVDGPAATAKFVTPTGVTVDPSGNVYVADLQIGNRIRKISTTGIVSTVYNGLAYCSDIIQDLNANFITTAKIGYVVEKVSPDSVKTRVAGSGTRGSTDGPAATATFNFPMGLTMDAAGNIFLAENDGNHIRKITAGGNVTTVAGSGSFSSIDGIGTGAAIYSPSGVVMDAAGNLFVTESGGHKIRKLSAPSFSAFTTIGGTASGVQQINISGASLSGNITVTAPTGFEVSLSSNASFASSVTVTATANEVASTIIYVRLAAAAAIGVYNGNLSLSASGATTQTMPLNGTVNCPVITASITASGNVALCPGSTVALQSNISAGNTYQWFKNNVAISGANASFYAATSTGSYTVVINGTGGCASVPSNAIAVTIQDVISPTFSSTHANVNVNATGANGAVVTYSLPAAFDNCTAVPMVTASPASGSVFPLGATLVTVIATDASGNSAQTNFTVIVSGLVPSIVKPADIVVNSPANQCGAAVSFSARETIGVPTSVITYTENGIPVLPGANFGLGVHTITATATNAVGYTATTFTITVKDVTPPVFTSTASIITPNNAGVVQATSPAGTWVIYDIPTAVDNCSGNVIVNAFPANGSWFPIGVTTVTVTAIDENNNSSQTTFDITVKDTQKPIVFTHDLVVELDASGSATIDPYGLDNGSTDNTIIQNYSLDKANFSCADLGINTVTLTVTDAYGNSNTGTAIITVINNFPPHFTSDALITTPNEMGIVMATSANGAIVNFNLPTATNNCGNGLTVVATPASGSVFPFGYSFVRIVATDASGNINETGFQVIVKGASPSIVKPADIVVNSPANQCGATVSFGATETTGVPASVITYTEDGVPVETGANFSVGVHTITATATNVVGYTATTFTITVNDVTPPVFTSTASIVTPNNAGVVQATSTAGAVVMYTIPTAVDNCSGNVIVNAFPASGSVFPIGVTTVNVTATDAYNNVSLTNFTVSVADTQVPTVFTQNLTVQLNASGAATINAMQIENGSTDNTIITNYILDKTNFDCSNVGANTVTLTVIDAYGNSNTGTAIVTVQDNIAPQFTSTATITTANVAGVVTATGANGAVVNFTLPTATDNCANGLTVVATPASGSVFAIGITTVTVIAIDASGNRTSTSFAVKVAGLAPVIHVPSNSTINAGSTSCSATAIFAATETTGIPASRITYTENGLPISSGATLSLGVHTITATAINAVGSTSGTFTITVKDVTAPTFIGNVNNIPANILSNVPEAAQYKLVYQLNIPDKAIWSSQSQIPYNVNNAAALAGSSFNRVAYYMELDNGKWVWVSMDKFTSDPSLLGIPTGSTVWQQKVSNMNVVASANAGVTAGTNIATGNIELWGHCYTTGNALGLTGANGGVYDFDDQIAGQNCYGSFQIHNYGAKQTLFAYNRWADNNNLISDLGIGNSPSGNPDWTFRSNANTITNKKIYVFISGAVSTDINANTDLGACSATVIVPTPTATDLCGSSTVTGVRSDALALNAAYPKGITTITWTATDASLNATTITKKVIVADNEAPHISGPSNINEIATSASGAIVNFATPIATDNCPSVTIAQTAGLVSGTTFPIGVSTITYTATDAVGLTTNYRFTVTVTGVPPVIVIPANITVNNDPGQNGAVVGYTATETTAIPASTITYSIAPGSFFTVGTHNVTATATNAVGESSGTFTVTVRDNEKPTIATAANIAVNNDANSCGALVTTTAPAATDNTSVASVIGIRSDGAALSDAYPVATTTITWTATDSYGNFSSSTQTITVTDNQLPTITAPATVNVNTDQGVCAATNVALGNAVTADNCGVASVTNNAPSSYLVGTTTVTWTVTDIHGNFSTATQDVVVTDKESPTITAVAQTQAADAGVCKAAVTVATPVTGDNCGVRSITNSINGTDNASGVYPVGITTITWTVTDIHDNVTTATQVITVNDEEKPNAVAQNITIQLDANGTATITPAMINNGSTDNCSIASVTLDKTSFYCSNVGVNMVTLTVTDVHGNVSYATATVTVEDRIAPIAIAKNITLGLGTQVGGLVSITAADINNGSTDACGIASMTVTPASFGCGNIGANTVTLTVTDVNGNVSTTTAVVTVVDDKGPVPTVTTLPTITGQCYATVLTLKKGEHEEDHDGDDDHEGLELEHYTLVAPTAMDNCTGLAKGTTTDPLTYYNQGTYIIHWKYVDARGNITIQEQTVIVKDTYAPVPKHATLPTLTGQCSVSIATGNSSDHDGDDNEGGDDDHGNTPWAKDNCSGWIKGTTTDPLTYTVQGTYTITWSFNDGHGNISTQTQTVIVKDITKPKINAPKDKTIACGSSILPAVTGMATATDNCATPVVTFTDVNSGTQITRTWKATDAAGNSSTAVQIIKLTPAFTATVASTPTSTVYTGGSNTNLYLGYGAQSTILSVTGLPTGSYTYSWSGANLSNTSSATPVFSATAAGVTTIYVTVTNANGCSSTASIAICVTDIRVPGSNGAMVYVCHVGTGKTGGTQTLSVPVAQVAAHLNNTCTNGKGGDRLGSCSSNPCNTKTEVSAVDPKSQDAIEIVTLKSDVSAAPATEDLNVTVMPNPSTTYFTLKFASKDMKTPISLRVMDASGRAIDSKQQIDPSSTIQIGHSYPSGTFYTEVIQGNKRKTIQLIKARG